MSKVKSKKVNWFVKHKILSVIIVLLLLMFIFAPASNNKPNTKTATNNNTNKNTVQPTKKKAAEPPKQVEPAIVYNLSAGASGISTDTLDVAGTTNLPNGALLSVVVERIFVSRGESEERFYRIATTSTSVKDGKFSIQVKVNDKSFLNFEKASGDVISSLDNNVQVTVTFDPKASNQPSAVVSSVGSNGEKLESSPQKTVFGSLTKNPVNQLSVEIKTPLSFPYSDQLPK
jgi:hypothetical protein